MILDGQEKHPGARLLFVLACLVVIVYGLRYASPILLPSALALFLAVLSLPVMLWLRKHKLHPSISIMVPVIMNVGIVGLLILLASQSVAEFQAKGFYVDEVRELQASWIAAIESSMGFDVSDYVTLDLIDPAAVVDFATGAVGRAAQFLGTTFVVFLIMAFMLSEASVFPQKFRYITGQRERDDDHLAKVVAEVQTYLGIKTVMSLTTGIVLGVFVWQMGLDFPVLLGLIAFMLNYIPTVGSIIAAVPALLLSLILFGTLFHALTIGAGYILANMVFGNILEPKIMGRRLGLSTLVVILSLLFWGWAWGPMGALLSVPLTVMVKIWLENTRDLRWLAILLDKAAPRVSESTLAVQSPGAEDA
jgi:predicted PurR-regulated permease PerM|tara:strand:+ start:1137 stop:2225 length:1089 start_codon:yes stop_codon:yes gene_type:complete